MLPVFVNKAKRAPATAHHKRRAAPAARTVRDATLKTLIIQAYEANYRVYVARKIWRHCGSAPEAKHPYVIGVLIHRSDAGSQYTSFALAEHLDPAGVDASIGSVGDAYDNALMESTIGLFKTELIKPRRPWKTLDEVELAAAEWIDWYCRRRLHGEIGTPHPPNTRPTTTEQPRLPGSHPTSELYRTGNGSPLVVDTWRLTP